MTRNLQDCPNKNDQYDHWLLGPLISQVFKIIEKKN